MAKIPVLEMFGPTIQGEGDVIGVKTVFIRTAGCDYRCSWCDSAFTWDGSQKPSMLTPEEIMDKLENMHTEKAFNHVTISGGNPALINALGDLIPLIKSRGWRVGLETQGSKWNDWFLLIDNLTISPKPPSSLMKTDFNALDDIIYKLHDRTAFGFATLKVVVFDEEDYQYAKQVHERYHDVKMFLQVGNADVKTPDNDALIKALLDKLNWLAEKVCTDDEMNDVRVLPQLHALLWGNKQGV